MGDTLYSALSGSMVKELELQMVANNLANANTDGYKETTLSFESVMESEAGQNNDKSTPFVKVAEKQIDFSSGAMVATGNQFDLAIQGPGFFEVSTDKGNFYTRNGAFTLNEEGELITAQGNKVVGDGGTLKINGNGNVQIDLKGNILVNGESQGKIKVVEFDDPNKLDTSGGSMFVAGEGAAPKAAAISNVIQGKRESSNVNMMKSIVRLIDINRQYQAYQKVIQMESQMKSTSVGNIA